MKIFPRRQIYPLCSHAFTLVEMVIVISIVSVISTIVIFNYGKYQDNVELSSSAQKIVLALQEAQVWGTAVREFPPGTGIFDVGYGVYFNTANPGQFIFFADSTNDNKYNGDAMSSPCGPSNECLEKTIFKTGYSISALCGGNDASSCTNAPSELHLVFTRPNVGETDTGLGPTIKDGSGVDYKYVKITITSPQGESKYIEVQTSGTISMQ